MTDLPVMFHATSNDPDLIAEHGLLADPAGVAPDARGFGFDDDERFCEPGVYMAAAADMDQWLSPYVRVYRIDTAQLDPDLLQEDMNVTGAWVYYGDVPVEAIELVNALDLDDAP